MHKNALDRRWAAGDGSSSRELDDEHEEARYVAGEIERLVDEGAVAQRDRRLLPDERAEPRAGGHARARRDRLPGDRRDEVLRARRDQGRDRLPDAARQPAGRRRASSAIVNSPRRGIGETSLARVLAHADTIGHQPSGRRSRDAGGGPRARRRRGQGARPLHGARWRACGERAEQRRAGRRPARGGAARVRLPRGARGRADDRGGGPDREPRRSSSDVAREFDASASPRASDTPLDEFLAADRARRRRRLARRTTRAS